MLRLLVDFNDIQEGIAKGLVEGVTGPHRATIGDRVLMHDDGEHEMWGTVTRVRSGLVEVAVEWSTWRPTRHEGTRTWRRFVPKLTVDVVRTFEPGTLPATAHALPWAERYGESTNV